MARQTTHPQRKVRRELAETRKEIRDQRSELRQLKELDQRLGKGVGARRERARLEKAVLNG